MRFLFRRHRLHQELHKLRGAIAELERDIERTEEALGETSEVVALDAYSAVQRLRDAMVREELRRKRAELGQMLEREARLQRWAGKPEVSAEPQPAVGPEAGFEPAPVEETAYPEAVTEETPEVPAASYGVAQSYEQAPAEPAEEAAYAGAVTEETPEAPAASYEVVQRDEPASTYEPASPAQAAELPPVVEVPRPVDGGSADLVEDEVDEEAEEKGGLGTRQLIVAGGIVGIIAIGLMGVFFSGSVGQSDDSAPGLLPTAALPAAALTNPPPPAVAATAAPTIVPTVAPAALSPGGAITGPDVPPEESADTAPAEPAPGVGEPEPQSEGTEQPVMRVGTVRVPGFNAAVVRAAPSLSSRVVTSVVNGGQVQLLEGAASGDGLRWVRVRAPDGNTGWMAVTLLEVSAVQASAPPPRRPTPPSEGQTNLG